MALSYLRYWSAKCRYVSGTRVKHSWMTIGYPGELWLETAYYFLVGEAVEHGYEKTLKACVNAEYKLYLQLDKVEPRPKTNG